jgi:hypothetical protein
MRFDKWFKYFWTINLSFLILSLIAAAYFIFIIGCPTLDSILANPFDLLSHLGLFPAPVFYLFFIPFFLSGYVILAMGIIEVYTSRKSQRSKILWIASMLVIGVMITVIYYFVAGRNQLTD